MGRDTTPRRARPALASLFVALASAAPAPAQAEVVVDSSLAQTAIQVMSGVFLFEFAAPQREQQVPVTSFSSSQLATPPGPHPATASASQTAEVTAGPEGLTASAEGSLFVGVPGVPEPPPSNLFASAQALFALSFHVTERATVSLSAQALGSEASGDAATITCSQLDGSAVERRGTSVALALQLEAGEGCSVSAAVIVERNGNREFLNPGEREGVLRVSVNVSELGPDDGTVFRWVGPAQGAFDEPGHWQNENGGDGVPGFRSFEDADTAIVEGATSLDLDLAGGGLSRARGARGVGATRRTGRLAVRSTQILRPVGGTLILDSLEPGIGARSLEIGGARLLLDQGGVTARHAVVGQGSDGELEVVGPDGFFTTLGRLGVGGDADGHVTVRDGAQATSAETVLGEADGSGFGTAQGAGTLWQTGNLALGFADDAGLSIEGGARVESENAFVDCQISEGPDVPGCAGLDGEERAEAVVTGAGSAPSTWEVGGFLDVGTRGKVTVEGGARLAPSVLRIGSAGGEADCVARRACVEVVDGTLEADGIEVGHAGNGKLRIGPAGRASALVAAVVGNDLTRGEVTVVGPSDEDQLAAPLSIGLELGGRGELLLQSGARVAARGGQVGGPPGSEGVLELQGDPSAPEATVLRVVDGTLEIGPEGESPSDVFAPTGELVLSNAVVVLEDTSLDVNPLGRVSGTGRIDGSGIANSVLNQGVIGCGVQLDAIYVQAPTGVVECPQAAPPAAPQLSPLAATRFARAVRAKRPTPPPPPPGPLVVTGNATLDGTLVLRFLNGFAPSEGDAFDLVDVAGNVTGAFASVVVQGLAPGADFAQDVAGGRITLTSLTDAEPLPVVSVKAQPTLRESRSRKGLKIKVARTGDTSEPLAVQYVVRGAARNGLDYVQLPGVVEIPARKKSAKLALRAFPDGLAEGVETFTLELVPGDGYQTSLFSKVAVAIEDEKPKKRPR